MTNEDGLPPFEARSATGPSRELAGQDPLLARADRAIEEAQRLRAESRRSLDAAYATSARVVAAALVLRQILAVRPRSKASDDGMPAS